MSFALVGGAHAAGSGCAAFAWPLETEKAAFADASIETVAAGASRGTWKQQAFLFRLQPIDTVSFVAKPGGKAKSAGTYGGLLTFDAPEAAGTFQVTLSDGGWVDVVQNGTALKSAGHTGAKDCPGLRKSVRFAVDQAPVVLQVSGVAGDAIKVAITPVQ
ncbi:MAG: hypothetical protein JXO22_12920 [Phycisphaerae bacterium]|nr:hypothetical protein [Phycisphaerae bacterium]